MVFAGRPGPLSLIEISPGAVDTLTTISGAMPASSQASTALSTSSFRMHERPINGMVAGLRRQLLYGAEFEQPGGAERLAMQARCRRSRVRLGYGIGIESPPSDVQIPASRATAPGPLYVGGMGHRTSPRISGRIPAARRASSLACWRLQ